MFEPLWIRFRSILRLLIGVVGFGLIAYAVVGLYATHQRAQGAEIPLGVRYESVFTSVAEGYFLMFGAGVVIVLLVSR
jgi:hypothetical protein